MIDVTDAEAQRRAPAKTQLELYLRLSPLIGHTLRIDTLGDPEDMGGSEIEESISGVVDTVSFEFDDFDDERSVIVMLRGEDEANVVTVYDRVYRLDGTGWTLFSEELSRDEDEEDDL